jgi:hypothetical protein
MMMGELIDRSKLPRIRIVGSRGDRFLKEIIGVLNDAIQKAPTIDAVPREEHELLLKRFRHLLESDFIRSFDEYDRKTGTYKRDISEADSVAHVVRCKDCQAWGRSPYGHPVLGWCILQDYHRAPDYFCASAKKRGSVEVK